MIGNNHVILISVKVNMCLQKWKNGGKGKVEKCTYGWVCPYCHTGMVEQACAICESLWERGERVAHSLAHIASEAPVRLRQSLFSGLYRSGAIGCWAEKNKEIWMTTSHWLGAIANEFLGQGFSYKQCQLIPTMLQKSGSTDARTGSPDLPNEPSNQ